MNLKEAAEAFAEFARIIKALRTPETGCPWDLEQDHQTLRPYLIEETYEVVEAIDRREDRALREELGDLLLQVLLHAQIADDNGTFCITDVIRGISEKMVRRHPHVFGTERVESSKDVLRNWDKIKAAERTETGADGGHAAALGHVPEAMPALLRAQRIGEKAAKAGLHIGDALACALQRLDRWEQEVPNGAESADLSTASGSQAPKSRTRIEHDLGEILFSLCRHASNLGVSAEDSLHEANKRFLARFRRMESEAPNALNQMTADEVQKAWKKTEVNTQSEGQ